MCGSRRELPDQFENGRGPPHPPIAHSLGKTSDTTLPSGHRKTRSAAPPRSLARTHFSLAPGFFSSVPVVPIVCRRARLAGEGGFPEPLLCFTSSNTCRVSVV